MRKLFLMAFAIAVFMSLGAGSALAQGSGKPCPEASPGGQEDPRDSAPNCGKGKGGDKGGGGGGGGGTTEPPAGACEGADLVLLTDAGIDARIVCLFQNGELANEENCPDAILVTGPVPPLGGGACVFLPPDQDE